MARFDVYEIRSNGRLVVDVQAELLRHLKTRLVIPLFGQAEANWPSRLAPAFPWQGSAVTLGTPFVIGIPTTELKGPLGSLAEHEYAIAGAVDFLLTGV